MSTQNRNATDYYIIIILLLFIFDGIFMECQFKLHVGMICIGGDFNTQMLLIPSNVAYNSLLIVNIHNDIYLKTPKKDPNIDFVKFSYVTMKNVCIRKLDEGFFGELGHLKKISLINVTCLNEIREIHFKGLGDTLTSLVISMPDLEFIEKKALMGLKKLKVLKICHSKIKELPENLFSLSYLSKLDFSSNYLVRLPFYPLVKPLFLNNFQIFGNYWICDCGMKIYVEFVSDPKFIQSKCFNPIRFRGLRMCDVKDMCGPNDQVSSNHSHYDNKLNNNSLTTNSVNSNSSNTLTTVQVTYFRDPTTRSNILVSTKNTKHFIPVYLILTISTLILLLLLLLFACFFFIRQIRHSQQLSLESKYKSRFISTEEL